MKKTIKLLICLLAFMIFPVTAHADVGPKPTVTVDFYGMGGRTFYATLLSEYDHYGPWAAASFEDYPSLDALSVEDKEYAIAQKFINYEDSDGFYYLQHMYKCDADSNSFCWSYYPPDPFKVLVYYPDTDTFAVSEIYQRKAFDGLYTAALNEEKDGIIPVKERVEYTGELASFALRVVLTILIELAIALIVGYREKVLVRHIIKVNIFTQVILNVLLSFTLYYHGLLAFILIYFFAEFAVFAIEAVAYATYFPKHSAKVRKPLLAVLYALVANVASFFMGMGIQVFFE